MVTLFFAQETDTIVYRKSVILSVGKKLIIMDAKNDDINEIIMVELSSPLGPMLACATETGVCILEFINRIRLEKELKDIQKLLNGIIVPGKNKHLDLLETELKQYFAGTRKEFTVPLHTPGNDFAQSVWKTLQEIPYGKTCSYKE